MKCNFALLNCIVLEMEDTACHHYYKRLSVHWQLLTFSKLCVMSLYVSIVLSRACVKL